MASNATGNAEIQVSTLAAESIFDPSITLLPAGGWIAVWTAESEDDVEFSHTLFQRFDAGGNPVGPETQVGDPEVFHTDATVLPLADGGWLVIHDGSDIVQQRFDSDGNAVGVETQINTVGGDLRGIAATALEDGGWVVGWERNSFNEQVFQQVFDAQGNAVGGEVRVNTTTSGRHFLNDIEALQDGGWVVVWNTSDGNVEQQRFDANGDPVDGETRVNTIDGGPNSNPTVTALLDGGWVVTWADPDGDQQGIFQQRYDSNGDAVGSQTGVNTTTASFQSTPDVTALPDGGWVVVWHSGGNQDGDLSGVYMQRFDANGVAVGTETLVNVTTAGDQSEASVTALDGGGWVVTWVSADPDTFDEVVMQRVFAADIEGTDGNDVIDGTVFGEAIFGLAGDDVIDGGDGDDTIEGGAGADNMDGGTGIDTLNYAGSAQGVTVRLSTGTASGGDAEGDTFQNFENITGSAHNDTLEGTTGVNVLKGGAGNDTLIGRGGADTLEGGDGNDTFEIQPTEDFAGAIFDGGAGNDRLLLRTDGEGAHVYDLTEATLASIEEIEFFADGGDLVEHTKTVSLAASQIGGAGPSSTLLIDGNDSSNSPDLIAISMGAATSLDLSGWTFQQWGTEANRGDGEVITISGDDDAETITGSSERDVISGGGGDDTLNGGGGDDIIFGGAGADTLDGGDGIDTLSYANSSQSISIPFLNSNPLSGGDAEGDRISNIEIIIGSALGDRMEAAGARELHGGGGNDTLIARGDVDLYGGDGDDLFGLNPNNSNRLGQAIYDGGAGNDRAAISVGGVEDFTDNTFVSIERLFISDFNGDGSFSFLASQINDFSQIRMRIFGSGDVALQIAMGDETALDLSGDKVLFGQATDSFVINGDDDAETITGSRITDVISGGGGDDVLDGREGDDTLNGGAGNDILNGGAGDDILNGGDGTDTADYSDASGAVTVNLGAGTATGAAGNDTLANIEIVIGTADADTIIGDGVANVLDGGGGDDTINGGSGNDTLIGGSGNDMLIGGAGFDSYDGGSGSDTVSFAGAAGWNIDLTAGTATTLTGFTTETLASIENIIGSDGNDTITGTNRANDLDGGGGDDLLIGGGGVDNFYGGEGFDTVDLSGSNSKWRVDLGAGTAELTTATGNVHTSDFEGIESIIGPRNSMTLLGTSGNEVARGGDFSDIFYTRGGVDEFHGGLGNDTISFGNYGEGLMIRGSAGFARLGDGTEVTTFTGFENIFATSLDDDITGTAGNNTLVGRAGDDRIHGGSGDDKIQGDDGDDILTGGRGNDVINGGAGNDRAIFSGNQDQYDISTSGGGVTTVAWIGPGSGDGTDTLTNVEVLSFDDGLFFV